MGVALMLATTASATIIVDGPVTLGVNDEGHLNFPPGGPFTGLALAGVGDAINPGCQCEGWGITFDDAASLTHTGTASVDNFPGISNLTTGAPTSVTGSTFTSNVTITSAPYVTVSHAFAPSAGAPGRLFEAVVTITNTHATDSITGVTYRRAMDWDIPPDPFSEFITIGGWPATNLIASSDNGFASVDPNDPQGFINPLSVNTNITDSGGGVPGAPPTADNGSVFDFLFGTIGPGESFSFSIFYGATAEDPATGLTAEANAIDALSDVAAEVFALGQTHDALGFPSPGGGPGTFIFGFKGVGGTPVGVPEPASIAVWSVLGLACAFGAYRRKARR
jgi:type IV pilus assembly protein PilY1